MKIKFKIIVDQFRISKNFIIKLKFFNIYFILLIITNKFKFKKNNLVLLPNKYS